HPESLQKGLFGAPNTNCNAANAPPPPNNPPPSSGICTLADNCLTICEEVREGGATEDYIAGTGFWDRANQAAASADRFDIRFPRPAVEIKADWIQVSTIGDHHFNCTNLSQSGLIHVETVDGSCFALAGMQLIQASCISCHAVSSVRKDGFEGINLLTTNPVGFPQPLPSNAWIRRDFVWSLGLACPNGPHNPMQAGSLQPDCTSTLPLPPP